MTKFKFCVYLIIIFSFTSSLQIFAESKTPYIYYICEESDLTISPTPVNESGETYVTSYIPKRKGYAFLGWSRSKTSDKVEYTPNSLWKYKTSGTLYAKWVEEPTLSSVPVWYDSDSDTINSIIYTISYLPYDYDVMIALYNQNNRMLYFDFVTISAYKTKSSQITIPYSDDYYVLKAFMWESARNLIPKSDIKISFLNDDMFDYYELNAEVIENLNIALYDLKNFYAIEGYEEDLVNIAIRSIEKVFPYVFTEIITDKLINDVCIDEIQASRDILDTMSVDEKISLYRFMIPEFHLSTIEYLSFLWGIDWAVDF